MIFWLQTKADFFVMLPTFSGSTIPFRVIVKTDDNEESPAKTLQNGVTIAAQTDVGNIGFCLQFQQKLWDVSFVAPVHTWKNQAIVVA